MPVPELVLAGPLDFLKPVGDALGFVIGLLKGPFTFTLSFFYDIFHSLGPLSAIGAYGLAIIALTVIIKLALFPLYQKQLMMSRKTQEEQRRIAPELAALRKKHKGDPQKLNTEMMALYKEHGINPLGGLAGCLPTLAQLPILIGLYQAIYNFHADVDAHFLWISNLTHPASLNNPATWILPVLAGLTTYIQSKMMAPAPVADQEKDSQAAQMAQMSSTMSLIMPLVIMYFAFQPQVAQALVLYWIVSNIFSIGQQYFVNGWGQLPILGTTSAAAATAAATNGNQRSRATREPAQGAADITPGVAGGNGKVTPRKQTAGGKRRRR
jgi:YidC/Oxa1 family membrane protein insertase